MATKSSGDTAQMTITADILPDELGKTISNKIYKYLPRDTTEGWYYKLTDVTTSSGDLIFASNYLQKGTTGAGLAVGGSDTSVHANDLVKFLFVHNTGYGTDGTTAHASSVYLCFDGGTAAHNLVDAVEVGAGEVWFAKLPNTTVANLHAIAGQANAAGTAGASIQCVIAAVLDDVA